VRLPGLSGLELQRACRREQAAANRLHHSARRYPDDRASNERGAIEFLTKPFRDQDLLDAIETGLARDRARQESEEALAVLRERFDTLSSREREIMIQATAGRLNKQMAHDMGIAESTVKVHRTNLMRKMKARSLPELGRMADILKLTQEKPHLS
jgi:FixJ family two-component response regulator